MKLTTALYLTDLLSNIDTIFTLTMVIGFILFIISIVGKIACADKWVDQEGGFDRLWTSILKKWWVLMLICLPPIVTPAKNTMYLMMAASYLQESNLPTKVSKALELKLDKYIDELTTGKKSEKD